MKKSKEVPATLVIAIAASVAAGGCSCGPGYYQECRDPAGRVLPDYDCQAGSVYYGAHWVHIQSGGFGGGGGGFYGG